MSGGTALHALRRHYLDLRDAAELTDEELLAIPGFGKKSLEWVRFQQEIEGLAPTNRKTIKIHAPVFKIITALGLTPEHVKEMTISPHCVVVTLYKLNEHGAKYLNPRTGRPATERKTFEVVTSKRVTDRKTNPWSWL